MITEGYFFSLKLYVVIPHLNHLVEMVQIICCDPSSEPSR